MWSHLREQRWNVFGAERAGLGRNALATPPSSRASNQGRGRFPGARGVPTVEKQTLG